MPYRYDTYCGLYCGACFVMRVNQEGRVEEQAREWDRAPEEITCHGCKSDVVSGYCRTCGIKTCATDRGHEFCVQCTNYPCERLIEFRDDEWPHHSIVTENSADLGRIGLDRWLQDQERRWRCPSCSRRTSWYDESCPDCGARVVSSRDDEVRLRKEEGGH